MPPGARPNHVPRATPRGSLPSKVQTLEADRDNALKRIGILEAIVPAASGCCPGEWIVPELRDDWEDYYPPSSSEDCAFAYRWGPFEAGDTVDDAGIEFRGQITGGVSGSVVMTFPPEDRFSCDKDFLLELVVAGEPQVAAAHIDSATGDMTLTFPVCCDTGGEATDAIDVSFTPSGTITATNVQEAIEELDSDIQAIVPTFRGCRIRRTTNQAVNSTPTKLSFDAERFDTDAFHDNSTNPTRITIPSGLDGKYHMGCNIRWDLPTGTGILELSILLNNTTTIAVTTIHALSGGNYMNQEVTTMYELAATDYVEFVAFDVANQTVLSTGNWSPEAWAYWLGA